MKNRLVSLLMVMVLGASLVACGSDSTKAEVPAQEESQETAEKIEYKITACLQEDNENNKIMLQGFTDCMADYLGEDVKVNTISASEGMSCDTIASQAINLKPDLIFTVGEQMLESASSITDEIPIIATGVIDFKSTLRIVNTDGGSWDRTTGTNVSGVSSRPAIVDQVSLMIEATKDLQTVGLLFTPEDTDSMQQNEVFEAYLDQAGIPWKEYVVPESGVSADDSDEKEISTALTPTKFVASSAKEGMDNSIESLLDDSVLVPGINSPSSTRVASVSEYWTGGKVKPEAETEENLEETDKTAKDEKEETEPTLQERIKEVCDECSVIYIPYGSMLTDQIDTISTIANEEGVITVGGDTTLGQSTLVSVFYDPYVVGYAAGKKAVKVFNGNNISEIKVSYTSSDDIVKLYNADVAAQFEMEFPKSFKEINEFLDTYEYGSTTKRHKPATEEK
ncbi:MAG: hypothetical protein K5773_06310 [Pseudobutyrivibrio sp.]|nr:hypothetical protein [Pseudobutyrivibrio sp.]